MKQVIISNPHEKKAKEKLAKLTGKKISQLTESELRELLEAVCERLRMLDETGKIK